MVFFANVAGLFGATSAAVGVSDGWHHDPVATVPELRGDRILLNAHADEDAAAHAAGEDEETARRKALP